ncbi:MAG: phenylalanine--tRNA ligase subunit beta [Bacilli bacterium]
MRVKLAWLNELVDVSDLSIQQLSKIISLHSTEVESIETMAQGTALVVGHVLKCEPHPDSNHLHVCLVDVKDEQLIIVCGAPNVEAGQKVVVAKTGCVLPGGLTIKKAKIRGIESSGMICSLAEIGIENKYIPEEYQAGIFYFKNDVEIGGPALQALHLDDVVFDLSITPNRGDLMSMLGVAIEVGAVLKRPLKPLAYELKHYQKSFDLSVTLESKGCVGYFAQAFKNVEIKPSPWWLIARLIAFGVRPINNVVDITNYILALFGQPLHAFDCEKLGNKIVVREAYQQEPFVTLDGIKRDLIANDLVITNGQTPVALAGVMGGKSTEIDDKTTSVVIEAAVFDPMTVRKTSQRLGLRSESSARFERGVDINRTKEALAFTSYLLQTLANAQPMSDVVEAGITNIKDTAIGISEQDVSSLLGISVSKKDMISIFESLKFKVQDEKGLKVFVPNRRSDLRIKNDLIEEIGRLYGYENLPNTLPSSSIAGALTLKQSKRRLIRHTLANLGLSEVITYSLVNDQYNDTFTINHLENSKSLTLINPLTQERSILRKGLLQGLMEVVKYNFARKWKDLALFEIGKAYSLQEQPQEEEMLSLAMVNHYYGKAWKDYLEVDFYVIKGVLEELAKQLRISFTFKPISNPGVELHPKRSADVFLDNEKIGFIGSLHPQYAIKSGLDEVYVCEIKLSKILEKEKQLSKYQPLSKYPNMERDLAIVVSKDILSEEVVNAIKKTDEKLISDVFVFDVYTGENVEKDQKSLAIRIVFTANEPLSDEIILPKMKRIMKVLESNFHAKLRS